MLSSQVKFSADRQTDGQTDTGKPICPPIYRCEGGGHKNVIQMNGLSFEMRENIMEKERKCWSPKASPFPRRRSKTFPPIPVSPFYYWSSAL